MPTPTLEPLDRESVATIRSDGSRAFLFPADVRGRFSRARQWVAGFLIVLYLSLPWIQVNGYPAVFLDVAGRRFHLFGITLATQDLWLMFFVITGLGFVLFFITALLGRLWCGWACPQTVFLDHVYRKIERWIDGNALQRRALSAAPLSAGKIGKRVAKHGLYLLVSAVITHLFLAYFVSIAEVWDMVREAPAEHWGAFAFMAVSTGVLYFNFAWFREQLCLVICPYGRMQAALVDENSLVIGYDVARGEPRGPRRHNHSAQPTENKGDCVACNRCVQVCPVGIDIRQGLQMECIGCTACIDACDDVMTRLHLPTGLIRYDSQNGFAGKPTRWVRPRTLLYFALLLVGAGVAAWALSTVKPANFAVTRMTGGPYIVDSSAVRNQFLVRIVNKRVEPVHFALSLQQLPPGVRTVGFEAPLAVAGLGEVVQPLVLVQERRQYTGPFAFNVKLEGAGAELERKVEFLGPEARLLREEEQRDARK